MARIFRPSSPIHPAWISLAGPDAQDFLQRLTTVNVRELEPGHGAKGFFLTAQGKVRAFFTLWQYGPSDFAFELDAGVDGKWKQELLTAIDQFTFSERMTLADVSGSPDPENKLECRWIFLEPGQSPEQAGLPAELQSMRTLATDDEIRLCYHGELDFGRPWISAWARPARLEQWAERNLANAQPASLEDIEKWRILAGRPRVQQEITEATIPLEVGLRDGIAQGKGCYPGQEVIERIAALGSPARRLARIEGQGPPPPAGAKILNLAEPSAEVGEVTSSTPLGEGRFAALGLVRKIHAKEGLQVKFEEGTQGSLTFIAPYA